MRFDSFSNEADEIKSLVGELSQGGVGAPLLDCLPKISVKSRIFSNFNDISTGIFNAGGLARSGAASRRVSRELEEDPLQSVCDNSSTRQQAQQSTQQSAQSQNQQSSGISRWSEARRASAFQTSRYPYIALLDDCASDPADIESNMKVMDKLYDASFHSFIRNGDNVLIIAHKLIGVVPEFDLRRVVHAVKWLLEGWSLDNAAKFFKILTKDWSAEKSGIFFHLVTFDLEIDLVVEAPDEEENEIRLERLTFRKIDDYDDSKTAKIKSHAAKRTLLKLVAIMMAGESAPVCAKFIHYLTVSDDWSLEDVTKMVGFLDTVLDWDDKFFHEFTLSYVDSAYSTFVQSERELNFEDETIGIDMPRTNKKRAAGKISFEYLAALYRTNLALANYRLALADYHLASLTVSSGATGNAQSDDELQPFRDFWNSAASNTHPLSDIVEEGQVEMRRASSINLKRSEEEFCSMTQLEDSPQ